MAFWPLADSGPIATEVGTLASSTPPIITVTASGTAHTKGAWVQAHAATSAPWTGMWVSPGLSSAAASNTSSYMDIGFGAAGSEVAVVSNLACGYRPGTTASATVTNDWTFVPLYVPAGTRIAFRVQSAVVSKVFTMRIMGQYGGGVVGYGAAQVATTYGAQTTLSRGVTLTASATVNTFGSWTQIVAATTSRTDALLVTMQGAANTVVSATGIQLQLGTGAAAAEAAFCNVYTTSTTNEEFRHLGPGLQFPLTGLDIPVGERLSARIASSAGSQTCDVTLTAFTY